MQVTECTDYHVLIMLSFPFHEVRLGEAGFECLFFLPVDLDQFLKLM